jgi:hypothetical protein
MTNRCRRQYLPSPWVLAAFILFLLFLSGCAQDLQQAESSSRISQKPAAGEESSDELPGKTRLSRIEPEDKEALDTSSLVVSDGAGSAGKGRSTQECYHLQPAGSQQKKIKSRRCEPQSLPFARCRSGITSCRLGWNNGPLTWFACEKQHGNTSLIPTPASVLILAANKHNMPTGHVAYIEDIIAKNPPLYRLIFSHTNYDRNCSLETDIEAEYNSSTKTLDIHSGAWKVWGKGLPVAGFILR